MNIPNETILKNLDIITKYFFQYNNYVKITSPRSNGLHAGHLAIMIALDQIIPPNDHKNYYVSVKCLQFQLWKTLNYQASPQTIQRDINKLLKLGFLKKGNTDFKFKTYQYNI